MQSNLNLTRKQQEVLDFLLVYQEQFIQAPTLDELCSAMGLKSRGLKRLRGNSNNLFI